MIRPTTFAPAHPAAAACLAAAMLLPPPLGSHCQGCPVAEEICAECPASAQAERVDCHPRLMDPCCATSPEHPACGCCKRPPQRTVPTDRWSHDRQAEQLAVQPAATMLPADAPIDAALGTASRLAALSPAIPHRVLHCCWLI